MKHSPLGGHYRALETGENPTVSDLDGLFSYSIDQIDPNRRAALNRSEAIKLTLELIGGSAGIYYWPSAKSYAKNKATWLLVSLILGNTTSGVLFLVKATNDFLEATIKERNTPNEMKTILVLPTKKELTFKLVKTLLGSAFCAVPFAISAYLFPLPGCRGGCLALAVTHAEIANAILHAISWNFILNPQFWYYQLPILPFKKAYEKYKHLQLTPKQKQYKALCKKRDAIYQKYKNRLIDFYTAAMERIITDQANQQINNPNHYEKLDLLKLRSPEGIADLAYGTVQQQNPPKNRVKNSTSRIWCCCAAAHQFLLKRSGVIGALFMIAGSIGWIADPIYLGSHELELNTGESIAFGGLPAYSMTVLSAFYGSVFIERLYRFFTTGWDRPYDKLPVEVKLHPKIFALFTLVNGYLAFFSYATAEVLINKIFGADMWDAIRPHLENNAYPAMQLLSFMALQDLFVLCARKLTAAYGADDNKILAQLQLQSASLTTYLAQVKGEILMARLEKCSPEFLTQHLNITQEEFEQDKKELAEINNQLDTLSAELKEITSASSNKFRILSKSTQEEEEQRPLLDPKTNVSHGV